ncbi:Uncharacterised protein [Moraxella atlantae]|uniref:Uncharacterized protein n=1 Tax=Faucicola atlantae TaxID=34059 RepID=A0A378Q120_9GAMM|nr:Uncharacterised protein [Moraxella atlantae]
MVVREKNCYYAIALTDFFVFLSCAEKAIVKCDEFCYTHLTIFNVLHSTVKLRLNCEYAVT